jgi:copper(I)-binding protein
MKNSIAVGVFSAVLANTAAWAQVQVDDPWVRATVPEQNVTGAFMRLTAPADARLVSARSPLAGKVEIHEMVTEKDLMKMRPVVAIELPAGKTIELKPGGRHVMLFDLKGPVREGDTVPLTLVLEGRDGKRETIDVAAPVRPLNQTGHENHAH